jgi:hypothetical protein
VTRDQALEWAAAARAERAQLIDELTTGRLTLSGAFDRVHQDEHVASMRVLPVLEAVPGASKVATRRALAEIGVDERAPLIELDAAAMVERFGVPV